MLWSVLELVVLGEGVCYIIQLPFLNLCSFFVGMGVSFGCLFLGKGVEWWYRWGWE